MLNNDDQFNTGIFAINTLSELLIINKLKLSMIRSTFLLALIASAAQAVHLKINSEADAEASADAGEPKVLDSLVDGPNDGFPTDDCDVNIPAYFEDAVCFDG